MEKVVAPLEKGALVCRWNYSGLRMAVGHADGSVSVLDSSDPGGSSFSRTSKWKACAGSIKNVVWVPPEYGDAIACVGIDGSISVWEEVKEDNEFLQWKLCVLLEKSLREVLDLQFGISGMTLKLVVAYSDGHVKIYEFLDPLELEKWQLQAEFQNVVDLTSRFRTVSCVSASIAWGPRRGETQQSAFVLGFNADLPEFNSSKIWEFDEAHQRWLSIAELASPEDKDDRVLAVAWAPNIGRPYEIIALATCKGITIWHLGMNMDSNGRLSTEKVALLSGHDGEVWQLDWDMSGMTLASTGADGMVRLWQPNLNGVWQEQAVLDCGTVHN